MCDRVRAGVRGGEGSQRGCEIARGIFRDMNSEEKQCRESPFSSILSAFRGSCDVSVGDIVSLLSSLLELFRKLCKSGGRRHLRQTHSLGAGYLAG